MVRRIVAYVAAVVVMVVLGSVSHSLFVQDAWSTAAGMGEQAGPAAIPMGDRINWILHDLVGLQPLFGALAGVALLIAFLVAGFLARFTGLRPIVFAVAGAVAIFVLFTVMKWQLGTVGVFGARGTMGLAAQMVAGLLAGLLFAQLSRPRES
ncbi:MAG: hypothetical protein K8S25_17795 [Alphaproteobacteria bacterium]|nr:hypothetical protein [Alphaproteobacteria bacterium]